MCNVEAPGPKQCPRSFELALVSRYYNYKIYSVVILGFSRYGRITPITGIEYLR